MRHVRRQLGPQVVHVPAGAERPEQPLLPDDRRHALEDLRRRVGQADDERLADLDALGRQLELSRSSRSISGHSRPQISVLRRAAEHQQPHRPAEQAAVAGCLPHRHQLFLGQHAVAALGTSARLSMWSAWVVVAVAFVDRPGHETPIARARPVAGHVAALARHLGEHRQHVVAGDVLQRLPVQRLPMLLQVKRCRCRGCGSAVRPSAPPGTARRARPASSAAAGLAPCARRRLRRAELGLGAHVPARSRMASMLPHDA